MKSLLVIHFIQKQQTEVFCKVLLEILPNSQRIWHRCFLGILRTFHKQYRIPPGNCFFPLQKNTESIEINRNIGTNWVNPLSGNPTKWSNTFKQFAGSLPTNCLNVFDRFTSLSLKGLISFQLEVYLEPRKPSQMELFAKNNYFQPSMFFAKTSSQMFDRFLNVPLT